MKITETQKPAEIYDWNRDAMVPVTQAQVDELVLSARMSRYLRETVKVLEVMCHDAIIGKLDSAEFIRVCTTTGQSYTSSKNEADGAAWLERMATDDIGGRREWWSLPEEKKAAAIARWQSYRDMAKAEFAAIEAAYDPRRENVVQSPETAQGFAYP